MGTAGAPVDRASMASAGSMEATGQMSGTKRKGMAKGSTLRRHLLDVFCGPTAPLARAAERAGWSADGVDIQLGEEFDLTQEEVAQRLECGREILNLCSLRRLAGPFRASCS